MALGVGLCSPQTPMAIGAIVPILMLGFPMEACPLVAWTLEERPPSDSMTPSFLRASSGHAQAPHMHM